MITSQMTTEAATTTASTITSKAATTSLTVTSVSTETTTSLSDSTVEEALTSILSSSTASMVLTSLVVSTNIVTLESTTPQISATDWDFTVSLQNDDRSESTDSLATGDAWSATILSEINTTLPEPVTMSETTNMPVEITIAETMTVSEYFIDEEITADTLDFTPVTDIPSSTICTYPTIA